MPDAWEMLSMMRQGVWQGVELLLVGIVQAALTYWWVGPILVVLLISAGRKKLLRLARFVGGAWLRGGAD